MDIITNMATTMARVIMEKANGYYGKHGYYGYGTEQK